MTDINKLFNRKKYNLHAMHGLLVTTKHLFVSQYCMYYHALESPPTVDAFRF